MLLLLNGVTFTFTPVREYKIIKVCIFFPLALVVFSVCVSVVVVGLQTFRRASLHRRVWGGVFLLPLFLLLLAEESRWRARTSGEAENEDEEVGRATQQGWEGSPQAPRRLWHFQFAQNDRQPVPPSRSPSLCLSLYPRQRSQTVGHYDEWAKCQGLQSSLRCSANLPPPTPLRLVFCRRMFVPWKYFSSWKRGGGPISNWKTMFSLYSPIIVWQQPMTNPLN